MPPHVPACRLFSEESFTARFTGAGTTALAEALAGRLAIEGAGIAAAAAAGFIAGIGRLRLAGETDQTQTQQAQSRNDHFACIHEKSAPVHDLPIFFIFVRHESIPPRYLQPVVKHLCDFTP